MKRKILIFVVCSFALTPTISAVVGRSFPNNYDFNSGQMLGDTQEPTTIPTQFFSPVETQTEVPLRHISLKPNSPQSATNGQMNIMPRNNDDSIPNIISYVGSANDNSISSPVQVYRKKSFNSPMEVTVTRRIRPSSSSTRSFKKWGFDSGSKEDPSSTYTIRGSSDLSPTFTMRGSSDLTPTYTIRGSSDLSPSFSAMGPNDLSPTFTIRGSSNPTQTFTIRGTSNPTRTITIRGSSDSNLPFSLGRMMSDDSNGNYYSTSQQSYYFDSTMDGPVRQHYEYDSRNNGNILDVRK